jgi:hypothetical protein
MGCSPDGNWFGKPSYLGFWTAPRPWGPWTQVHEETTWVPARNPAARAYQPQIAPKWISEDGKSFWLVWSDFQSAESPPADAPADSKITAETFSRQLPYYSFNTQRVDLITA